MTAIVELEHIEKRYGAIAAVNDVSFALQPGESVALIGYNGAGKTTLFKMMLGLSSDGGRHPRARRSPRRRRVRSAQAGSVICRKAFRSTAR
jgi:ABC-type multidrug transport system ATPase subunit